MTTRSTSRRRLAVAVAALWAAAAIVGLAAAPADAAVTQTGSCLDGGGTRWSVRAIWGDTYRAADGLTKVTLDLAGWTTAKAGSIPTDARIRSYTATGALVQDRSWTGSFDYGRGSRLKSVNPVNPPSAPGQTKLKLTLGVDGDGFSSCSVTLVQPAAAPAPAPSPTTPAPSAPPSAAADRYEDDVLAATNLERTSRGLSALTAQACVDSYAEAQAQAMVERRTIFHQDLGPILTACRLSRVGENVASGYPDGKAVTQGWMGSAGHRANILQPEYRLIGIGAAQDSQGRWYAAQVFGTLR